MSKILVLILRKNVRKMQTNKVVKEIPIVNTLALVQDMSFVKFTF